MGEALADNSDHGLREQHAILRGRDRCPCRCEDSLHHADHALYSGDNGLLERENLPDHRDHFPGQREDGLRHENHGHRFPHQGLRHEDNCRSRSLSRWEIRSSSDGRF